MTGPIRFEPERLRRLASDLEVGSWPEISRQYAAEIRALKGTRLSDQVRALASVHDRFVLEVGSALARAGRAAHTDLDQDRQRLLETTRRWFFGEPGPDPLHLPNEAIQLMRLLDEDSHISHLADEYARSAEVLAQGLREFVRGSRWLSLDDLPSMEILAPKFSSMEIYAPKLKFTAPVGAGPGGPPERVNPPRPWDAIADALASGDVDGVLYLRDPASQAELRLTVSRASLSPPWMASAPDWCGMNQSEALGGGLSRWR